MAIPLFIEERFPEVISVGSVGGPEFYTTVDEVGAGFEYRNANWAQPRHRYDVATGITSQEELMEVRAWHLAMHGRATGFRFQDPQDFSSAPDGYSEPGPYDSKAVQDPNNPFVWYLRKDYLGFSRDILKPAPEHKVLVSANDTLLEQDVDYTVDYTKGTLTFLTPEAPYDVSCGFYFDVPVRFESDLFQARWDDVNLLSGNISLVELRLRR